MWVGREIGDGALQIVPASVPLLHQQHSLQRHAAHGLVIARDWKKHKLAIVVQLMYACIGL